MVLRINRSTIPPRIPIPFPSTPNRSLRYRLFLPPTYLHQPCVTNRPLPTVPVLSTIKLSDGQIPHQTVIVQSAIHPETVVPVASSDPRRFSRSSTPEPTILWTPYPPSTLETDSGETHPPTYFFHSLDLRYPLSRRCLCLTHLDQLFG